MKSIMIISVLMALQAQGGCRNHFPLEEEVSQKISPTIRSFLQMHKDIIDVEDELVACITSFFTNILLPPEAVKGLDPNNPRVLQYMGVKEALIQISDEIDIAYNTLCNSRDEFMPAFYTFDKPFVGAHEKESKSCVRQDDFANAQHYYTARFKYDVGLRHEQAKQLFHLKTTLEGSKQTSLSEISAGVEGYFSYAQERDVLMCFCLDKVLAALKAALSFTDSRTGAFAL
ncbi:MAG: hypothetical protein OXC30_03015 [Alphaproteobacteria bacterium]|nr:hypothetical protein [Alphaproteobacteria bacterium]